MKKTKNIFYFILFLLNFMSIIYILIEIKNYFYIFVFLTPNLLHILLICSKYNSDLYNIIDNILIISYLLISSTFVNLLYKYDRFTNSYAFITSLLYIINAYIFTFYNIYRFFKINEEHNVEY